MKSVDVPLQNVCSSEHVRCYLGREIACLNFVFDPERYNAAYRQDAFNIGCNRLFAIGLFTIDTLIKLVGQLVAKGFINELCSKAI